MVKQFSAFEYEHIISLCDFYLMDIRSVVLHLCYIAPILYNIQIEREREGGESYFVNNPTNVCYWLV